MNLINQHIIQQYRTARSVKLEIKSWYQNLIDTMKAEQIEQIGHMQRLERNYIWFRYITQHVVTTIQDKNIQIV